MVYKDTDQLIADGFLRRTPTTEESTPPERQEGRLSPTVSRIFWSACQWSCPWSSHPSPTDVQGKVTQDVITVNKWQPQGWDSIEFSCLDFQSMQMDDRNSADKCQRNFCNNIHGSSRPIVCLIVRQKNERLCQIQFRLTIFAVTSITCGTTFPPNLWVNNCVSNRFQGLEYRVQNFRIDIKEPTRIRRLWSHLKNVVLVDCELHHLRSHQLWRHQFHSPTWNKLIVLAAVIKHDDFQHHANQLIGLSSHPLNEIYFLYSNTSLVLTNLWLKVRILRYNRE